LSAEIPNVDISPSIEQTLKRICL